MTGERTDRRGFFCRLAPALAGAWMLLTGREARAGKVAIPLERVKRLNRVGGAITIRLKGREILLARHSEDGVSAVSPICSHEKCTVAYRRRVGRFECPCHGSYFDIEGNVLNGPATRPLSTWPAVLRDGRIIVDLGP
jgi:cytochrome b6-f complex iron-sulfur subunit